MEIDQDIKAMLNSFKKLDALVQEAVDKSKVPAYQRKASGDKDWKVTQSDLDKEEEKNISSKRGLEKLKKDTGIKSVKENADPTITNWLKRLK